MLMAQCNQGTRDTNKTLPDLGTRWLTIHFNTKTFLLEKANILLSKFQFQSLLNTQMIQGGKT